MSVSLIPDSAPFNVEQRAWLNGFLAGWLGIPGASPSQVGADSAIGMALAANLPQSALHHASTPTPPPAEPHDVPWHDPALPIADRMKLANGKPKADRLMAAMAQLDCGTCGYLCQTYSEAIANGSESSLTLCSPGGSETSKMIKKIIKESANANGDGHPNGAESKTGEMAPAKTVASSEWSRKNPFLAKLVRSVNLNGPNSDKATHHVEIELGPDGPSYEVGDSLGIIPTNCGDLVAEVIEAIGAEANAPVVTASGLAVSLAEALDHSCCLSEVTEETIQLMADSATNPSEAEALRGLIDDDTPIAGDHILDLLRRFPSSRPPASALVRSLPEIKPRLYSISSSPKRHAGQVHLTVRKVVYNLNERDRKGVASTMLADRVAAGGSVRVYVQKSHGFTIPGDPNAAMIMVGPGTGIAPFRAFLHERDAIAASGPNWLFFGDQKSDSDFLYRDELADFLARKVLTRLDTAFSRDQKEKIYVQDRITEQGAEVFAWLEAGASVFVCGDAKRMAADVDRALRSVIEVHGHRSEAEAATYINQISAAGRYRRDVY